MAHEKQYQINKSIQEKNQSMLTQMEEIKELKKSIAADRDFIKQEKDILEEKLKYVRE